MAFKSLKYKEYNCFYKKPSSFLPKFSSAELINHIENDIQFLIEIYPSGFCENWITLVIIIKIDSNDDLSIYSRRFYFHKSIYSEDEINIDSLIIDKIKDLLKKENF